MFTLQIEMFLSGKEREEKCNMMLYFDRNAFSVQYFCEKLYWFGLLAPRDDDERSLGSSLSATGLL